jgi:ATP-dependent Clp protease ATP-binding subunit ClpC
VEEKASSMFERFMEWASKVVVLAQAQEEARSLGHAYIGTEHIMLGLVREREGVANQILFT